MVQCKFCGNDPSKIMTPDEVAEELKISKQTALRIINANRPIRIGSLSRWTREQLDHFRERGGMLAVRGTENAQSEAARERALRVSKKRKKASRRKKIRR